MPEIVPAKACDLRPLEHRIPRRPESRAHRKYTLRVQGLFAPAIEDVHGFLVQEDMTCLATLRLCSLDRQEFAIEVDGLPPQGK